MRYLLIGCFVILLAPRQALADDVPTARDPDTGLYLSVAGSVVPLTLIGVSFAMNERDPPVVAITGLSLGVITPSLGEIYGGRYLTYGMPARALGAALMVVGIRDYDPLCGGGWGPCDNVASGAMMISGLTLYLGGMVYDIATASDTARRWNRRHLSVTPIAMQSKASAVAGFAITGEL